MLIAEDIDISKFIENEKDHHLNNSQFDRNCLEPGLSLKMEHFCAYCGVVMPSEAEFQVHCTSESHQLTIMSDEGREWKFRPPARGVPADQYVLCCMFAVNGKCRLGQQCCDAHGEEELNEWKERYSYRQMKLQHAKECSLQGTSYTDQLLEKWLTATNPMYIMKEKLEHIETMIEPETNLTVSEKNCCREWTIRITNKAVLHHVALLYESHRSHFRISQVMYEPLNGGVMEFSISPQCQEWSNGEIGEASAGFYTCKVRFVTSIYGTFRQAIVFDFGGEPVLVKKLSVDVVSISDLEKLQQARENVISFTERWSSDEVSIVPFENRPYPIGHNERSLLNCYPAPDASKFSVTQAVMEPVLSKENYSARLHELLCIEEMAQYELLSRYNVKARLNLSTCYLLTPNSATTAKYCHGGELFANMKLTSALSEDSSSGRLILTNCSTVLIAPLKTKGQPQRKVYEALIEDKGKTVIYLRISKQCSEDLNLLPDREFVAEVQFQLNRLPLCEMHFAVDRLHPPSIIFPDVNSLPHILWNSESNWLDKLDSRLNSKQKEAVMAITAPISARLPPLLIIGPFGTGKTFTLAQAVKQLLRDPQSRVLVCTHSNSAADIYIREYLHPLVADGHKEATPLRIYYTHRWVATVHPTVQLYCLVSKTESDRSFNIPTVEDVKKHKVVVTTLSTSRYLVQLGLEKGTFTHILIDEAAQAMECEAIMPLSLAGENTRIVLAGDHMQLSPEVYSQFAQERNLHTSLLERLYDLYHERFPCKVLLCENYRSHEAIIKYTSELFYDNHLIASAKQPRHEKYYPMTFFTARGDDVQDVNSTAYHNNAEVYEIVERVIELKRSWPEEWGDQDETSIGVVTPYYDQVIRIRGELRKKKLHGVSVERVLNVQGKQFRVIFLSTVRTRQTCNGPKLKDESDLNHGFLSNARLLNTAITRAQSLVAVVGDPVSLCSVGKCRKLWEKFILTCHKEDSLFGITWDSLRSHLDSMELKKNFILNPLAPEFVPGRMFHGQPSTPPLSTAGEFSGMPDASQQSQPMVFIPLHHSPFQGPPLMQPTMPHILPSPHPYGLGMPSVLPPPPPPTIAPHAFTSFAQNPLQQQTQQSIQARISSAFPRRLGNPRFLMEQLKELEQQQHNSILGGRAIKRTNAFPVFSNGQPNAALPKPVLRVEDQRNQNQLPTSEDPRRLSGRELQSGGFLTDHKGMNSFPTNVATFEKMNKISALMKTEENSNTTMLKQNLPQATSDIANFNGMPDGVMPHLAAMKCNMVNGIHPSFPPKSFVESDGGIFPPEMGVLPNPVQQQQQNQYFMNSEVGNNSANTMAERDKALAAALDGLLSPVNNSQQSNFAPQERWAPNSDSPSRLEMFQHLLQEKLAVLEKILPTGTDLKSFLESPVFPKVFFNHLMQVEGPVVAKRFFNLMMSIKQDQEVLIRYQQFNNFAERGNLGREYLNGYTRNAMDFNVGLPMRVQGSPVLPGGRPSTTQPSEVPNGFEPFRFERPFSLPFGMEKNDARLMYNGEYKNGYVRMPMSSNSMMKAQEPFSNGPMMEKTPEQLLFEMRSMSLAERNSNPKLQQQSLDHSPAPFHGGESISEAVRRAEMERKIRGCQKDLWAPLAHPIEQSVPMDLPPDSYLSKLRNISSCASTSNSIQQQHQPTPQQQQQVAPFEVMKRSPTKASPDAPAQMTPFSMGYPDINILPSHMQPNGKESVVNKVIQKPSSIPRSLEENQMSNATTNQQRPSPYLFDFNVPPSSSTSVSSYSPISSEGMTYAKILRSPHQ